MTKFDEQNLVNLGFELQPIDDGEASTHYYTKDFGDEHYGICLISNTKLDVEKDGGWFVEIFEAEGFRRIFDFNELKTLNDILEKLAING
jgi:hypothetical protein